MGTVDFLTSAIQACADIEKGRGENKRDLDNDTWAFILDMCPSLRRHFHQCGSESWNTGNRGNAAEAAAGVSFVAYTGQVFLEQ